MVIKLTPKEKAWVMVDKMSFKTHKANAKMCALVAVDEILEIAEPSIEQVQYTNGEWAREYREIPNRYWTKVRQEIENL